ncbi:GntR family transcriptional regulator [Frankia sp. Mgl5]|uniref:FadR/GntR family transcriptional regulator n=1 Tax=Frankia sp. Mgl5 TaxID=2933793 RepID=UPI00201063E2|nr:GntR family transcriptional regulator [Frankia sp. Mgl5]MCK9930608.1 GntR family transcriptional regulator [Frankia sp. Mgl5]
MTGPAGLSTAAVGVGSPPPAAGGTLRPSRRSRKIAHLLAADLRRQILRGEFAVDQQLSSEGEMTAALGVSRETLREALRILEAQHLVDVRRGRGGGVVVRRPGLTAVARYTALLLQLRGATIAHLEEARSVLEPPAAELVAVRCGPEGLDHLVALHRRVHEVKSDPLAFATAVTTFDQAVTDLSGNRSIAVIAGVLREIYAGQVFAAVNEAVGPAGERVRRQTIASHSEFLAAAQRRDGDAASRVWSDYLLATSRLLVRRSLSRQQIDVAPLWRAQSGGAAAAAGMGGRMPPARAATAVTSEIRARIAEGSLAEGDRLPSLADLSTQFGVSRPTLREALRILEMESLLELRAGDRAGPRVCHPSTQVATQLAGTVLEARHTTLGDFFQALRLIEPALVELAAARMDQASIPSLRGVVAELTAAAADLDMPRFTAAWPRGTAIIFAGTGNPVLAVIAEIMGWVRVATRPALAMPADDPWAAIADRIAAQFGELIDALATGDSARARSYWVALLDANTPFVESTGFAGRLMIDVID